MIFTTPKGILFFVIFFLLSAIEPVYSAPLLLTPERQALIASKHSNNGSDWQHMEARVQASMGRTPYRSGEFAAASMLAFMHTDNQDYLANAKRLYEYAYHSSPDVGWGSFRSKNLFRIDARWALVTYNWLKPYLTEDVKARYEAHFITWAEYWLTEVDYENEFSALRFGDTDNVTSLAENLLLLGYVLNDSNSHQQFGKQILAAADSLFSDVVIGLYMRDIMRGGVWAEGNDYGPQTQVHWVIALIINQEHRNLNYELDYPLTSLKALNQMTLSGYTDIYKYGSVERADNYTALREDGRYEFTLAVQSLLTEEQRNQWFTPWWTSVIQKEGHSTSSINTGIWRVLFEPIIHADEQPNTLPLKEYPFIAEGVGFVATGASQNNDFLDLFMINRKVRVDHEHRDALSFDLAFNGEWITKEVSGYSGIASQSVAHNTLLIENADSGSSSPTRRPIGDPYYYNIFDNDIAALISAEAAPAYNMSGYFSTTYAKQVTRQLALIKPNIVAVYDRVVTDPTQFKDLIKYKEGFSAPENGLYFREVKLIQHFQTKPQVSQLDSSRYLYETDAAKVAYGIAYPKEAHKSFVDEKELWLGAPEYQAPLNQRNWHMQVESQNTADSEFITYFIIQNKTQDCLLEKIGVCITDLSTLEAVTTQVFDSENRIVAGNAIALKVKPLSAENTTVIWNRDPSQPLTNLQIRLDGNERVIISGLIPEHRYELNTLFTNDFTDVTLEAIGDAIDSPTLEESFRETDETGVIIINLTPAIIDPIFEK